MSSGLLVVYLISLLALGSACDLFEKLLYIFVSYHVMIGLDSCIVNKGEKLHCCTVWEKIALLGENH
jgi:hypothetical protein